MEFELILLLIFLLLGSIWDIKERAVPVWFFLFAMVVVFVMKLLLGEILVAEQLGGMMIGVLLLIVGKLTKGQIGEADGITFIITGFVLGFWDNFLLLTEALFLSFFWSLVFMLLKKINLKSKLPFLPFVLAAFLLGAITG